jgi:hypothetical protein
MEGEPAKHILSITSTDGGTQMDFNALQSLNALLSILVSFEWGSNVRDEREEQSTKQ